MNNYDEIKKALFVKDKDLEVEYNKLQPIYEIKEQLIKIRIEQGLSQADLAKKIGTQQSAISRLESGDCNLSIELLSKVAQALGKEVHITIQ
jgi:DNA-binding XRE family transcriptional regulator